MKNKKNVLILGAYGREHALAESYSKSKQVGSVHVAPGNDLMEFTSDKIVIHKTVAMIDFDSILSLCKQRSIDLVDVAQENAIAEGITDKLRKENIQTFGPTKKASEIEWSKKYSREFMEKYHLPTPRFASFSNQIEAIEYVNSLRNQAIYVKASGLAWGKGAIRANDKNEAIDAIKEMSQFGDSGKTFLIEECMEGEEFSLFVFCDGESYCVAKAAQDHKTVFNTDLGSNTGGMGCVAPTNAMNKNTLQEAEKIIIKPFLKGMRQENRLYTGVLYVGGMLTKKGIKIVEFNARWGSPEAEVIVPSIQTDYMRIVEAVNNKKLGSLKIIYDSKIRVSVAAAARGYPIDHSPVIGKEIFGIQEAIKLPGIKIFGSGIKRKKERFFVDGGRIFHLVAEGADIQQARRRCYEAMSLIFVEGNNLHYRTDIGWRDVERYWKRS